MNKICKNCGKGYKTYEKKRKYCSQKCYWEQLSSKYVLEKHPHWKGGRHIDGHGYITLQIKRGVRVREHRLIMEKHLGHKLSRYELVHHINEDRVDNRIENLQVVTKAEHNKIHREGGYIRV